MRMVEAAPTASIGTAVYGGSGHIPAATLLPPEEHHGAARSPAAETANGRRACGVQFPPPHFGTAAAQAAPSSSQVR